MPSCGLHTNSDFTTRKDACKAFLAAQGFPVPRGEVVTSLAEADADTLEREGLAYEGSDLVVLRDPSDKELQPRRRPILATGIHPNVDGGRPGGAI